MYNTYKLKVWTVYSIDKQHTINEKGQHGGTMSAVVQLGWWVINTLQPSPMQELGICTVIGMYAYGSCLYVSQCQHMLGPPQEWGAVVITSCMYTTIHKSFPCFACWLTRPVGAAALTLKDKDKDIPGKPLHC